MSSRKAKRKAGKSKMNPDKTIGNNFVKARTNMNVADTLRGGW